MPRPAVKWSPAATGLPRTYNFETRFQKPILFYWLVSAGYLVAGVNEAAARWAFGARGARAGAAHGRVRPALV